MLPEEITAGARTVVDLAVHFDTLKRRAVALEEQFSASKRGYFTPSEDEQTRHLLVTYWQARGALFEVIGACRSDAKRQDEEYPQAFLVAYAAALLLIDAARYLREAFAENAVARAKLNEPDPHFRIPAGVYDTAQRSLVSARHAWHLYFAIEYFAAEQDHLRSLASNPLYAELLGVIDRLQDRVRVSKTRFAATLVEIRRTRALARARRGMHRVLYRLQKLASSLVADLYVRPTHRPALPREVAGAILQLARPGDVFITRKQYALTNYFLPGYWPHAALFLGDAEALVQFGIDRHENVQPRWARLLEADAAEPRRVLEALKDGVWIRPATAPLACDAVTVLRPRLARHEVAEALARGLFHEGKPYDFDFDFTRSDRLVCTEVVYRSYEGIGGLKFSLTRRAGRMTFSAEDLIHMALDRAGFEPVAVYAPDYRAELLEGSAAEEGLRATHDPST